MIALQALLIAAACSGPACCVRHGEPAICRSTVIEREAKAIVMRQCRSCDPRKVAEAIYSLQVNEGPYESAHDLARGALLHVRRR